MLHKNKSETFSVQSVAARGILLARRLFCVRNSVGQVTPPHLPLSNPALSPCPRPPPAPPEGFKMASQFFFTNRFKPNQEFFRKTVFLRLFVCPVRTINMKTLCSLSFPVPAETSKNGKKLGFCVKSENCHVRFPAKPCIFRDSYYLIRIHHCRARLFEEGDMPELFTWAP